MSRFYVKNIFDDKTVTRWVNYNIRSVIFGATETVDNIVVLQLSSNPLIFSLHTSEVSVLFGTAIYTHFRGYVELWRRKSIFDTTGKIFVNPYIIIYNCDSRIHMFQVGLIIYFINILLRIIFFYSNIYYKHMWFR